jgi:GNAT superfamily N-acetyltransferase
VNAPRTLGDGLVLRRATEADIDALVDFNARLHAFDTSPTDGEAYDAAVGAWARDLLGGGHPATGPGHFFLVEDTATGAIASSACVIPQTWTYGGVPFPIGRVELVATRPTYRRRGLVRAIMEALHAESAARGELMQGITGIPWYYRQFGYEMALEMDALRSIALFDIPKLPAESPEPYHVRPASDADLPFIAETYRYGGQRYQLSAARDDALWRYELHGPSAGSNERKILCVIEAAGGMPVGLLAHFGVLWGGTLYCKALELAPGISWLPVVPSVLRYLARASETAAALDHGGPCHQIGFDLGSEHPLFAVTSSKLRGGQRTYAWYIRIADLPAFMRRIAPALEERIARSILVGHTGELRLNFYRDGLRLVFADGRLTEAGTWQPTTEERGDAAFPDLTFLQLLCGFRSLDDLYHTFPDCIIRSDEARALLNVLFPKQPSAVWPIA